MSLDIQNYKSLLEAELAKTEQELSSIAVKDGPSGGAWDASQQNIDQDAADREEVADNIETFEVKTNIVSVLESNLYDIQTALGKIEKGGYGTCEVCGKDIETERLDINPSARTCKADIDNA